MDYQEAIETLQDIYDIAERRIEHGDARGVIYIRMDKLDGVKTAISAMQELQAIHNNGINIERLKDIDFRKQVIEHINYMDYMDIKDELEEYKQIGTLEEIRNELEKRDNEQKYHCEDCVHLINRTKGPRGSITGICELRNWRGKRAGRTVACKKLKNKTDMSEV